MNTPVKLEAAKLPNVVANLVHSNQFLKIFSLVSSVITALSLVMISVVLTRPPLVLALAPNGQVMETGQAPKLEDEVKAAAAKYIELRYKWDPSNVKDHLKGAESFIASNALVAYQKAADVASRFSQEKQVTQRIYPEAMQVDLENHKISIIGDRITSIQNIRAAGNLKLQLGFDSGPRTKDNPWGIYVTKEIEN